MKKKENYCLKNVDFEKDTSKKMLIKFTFPFFQKHKPISKKKERIFIEGIWETSHRFIRTVR